MSENRHRGPAPQDRELFAAEELPALRTAVQELSWLLTRGYATSSALKLVGDRHALRARQRKAVERCACTDAERDGRRARRVHTVRGEAVHVDGFNALIVTESVLSGGPVLVGRDGASRDLASVHGTYKRVAETTEALDAIGAVLEGAREVVWWLDRPISNSGRLSVILRELAEARGWPWRTELVWDPDRELKGSSAIVATGDAQILDACARWIDLPGEVAARCSDRAWRIDLSS